ncbi:hypothetical protein C8Q79DRAFT_939396 [Trametes meyenii]|nr:hypothetical protein C8Q79DRAFT_939396 [Trametes meyenii]
MARTAVTQTTVDSHTLRLPLKAETIVGAEPMQVDVAPGTGNDASEPAAPKRPSRARDVSTRDLSQSVNGREMVYAVFCGVQGMEPPAHSDGIPRIAHKEIHDRANGELHGDINPNALLLFDRPQPDGTTSTEGGLIYWEPPISIQTLRKIGNPDKPIPPPSRHQYHGYMPPFRPGRGF